MTYASKSCEDRLRLELSGSTGQPKPEKLICKVTIWAFLRDLDVLHGDNDFFMTQSILVLANPLSNKRLLNQDQFSQP